MLAWCYGDLNQLALLIKVSHVFQINTYDDIIDNVASQVCRRSLDESLVRDSHFCHGASGVCFLFNHLYELTGRNDFLIAKNIWLEITLSLLEIDLKEENYKDKESQLLEGLVGVGLVLLSEISNEKLSWSKLLLM